MTDEVDGSVASGDFCGTRGDYRLVLRGAFDKPLRRLRDLARQDRDAGDEGEHEGTHRVRT